MDPERVIIKTVTAPALDDTNYAAGMRSMVDTINENFRRIVHSDWLKGDRGEDVHTLKYPLFECDGNPEDLNDWYPTELGVLVLQEVYLDADITTDTSFLELEQSVANDRFVINGANVYSCDNFLRYDYGREEYVLDDQYGYVSLLVLYREDISYYIDTDMRDFIDYAVFAGMYAYIDPRNAYLNTTTTNNIDLTGYVDRTTSLYGTAEYDQSTDCIEWHLDTYNVMPTLYWNAEAGYFCWKINGEYTNVTAQGVRGEHGATANTFVTVGEIVGGSSNPGEDTMVDITLLSVYLPEYSDDPTEPFVPVTDLPDEVRDNLGGSLAVVWFSSPFVDGTWRPSMTMGIVQRTEDAVPSYHVVYRNDTEDSNNHAICFDFSKILSLLSLKNSMMGISWDEPDDETVDSLRGLFIPIVPVGGMEDVTDVHMAYSDSSNNGMKSDLNIGVFSKNSVGFGLDPQFYTPPQFPDFDDRPYNTLNIGYNNIYSKGYTDIVFTTTTALNDKYSEIRMHSDTIPDPDHTQSIDLSVFGEGGTELSHIGLSEYIVDIDAVERVGGSALFAHDRYTNGKLVKSISLSSPNISLIPCVIWNVSRYPSAGTPSEFHFHIGYKLIETDINSHTWWKYLFMHEFHVTGTDQDADSNFPDKAELEVDRTFPLLEYFAGTEWNPMYVTLLKYYNTSGAGATMYECVLSGKSGEIDDEPEYIIPAYPQVRHYTVSADTDFYEVLFPVSDHTTIYRMPTVYDSIYRIDYTYNPSRENDCPTRISEELSQYINIYKFDTFGTSSMGMEMLYPNITTYHEYEDLASFKWYDEDSEPHYQEISQGLDNRVLFYPDSPVIVDYNVSQYIGTPLSCPFIVSGMYTQPLTVTNFSDNNHFGDAETVRGLFYDDYPVDPNGEEVDI